MPDAAPTGCTRCGAPDQCLPTTTITELANCPCSISGVLCFGCRITLDNLVREFWVVRTPRA